MSRRRRLRSARVARRVAKAAATASALLCVGGGGRSVEAFSFSATTATAAGWRYSSSSSSTAPAQRTPLRLGLGGTSPVWPSRHGSLGGAAAVRDTMFVPRRSGWGGGKTASAAARRSRPSTPPALSMAADVLSALGKDALMFLAATVAVVPACKKLNIRCVVRRTYIQVTCSGAGVRRCVSLSSGVLLCLLGSAGLRTRCRPKISYVRHDVERQTNHSQQ